MSHILKAELLDALKRNLRDLEGVRLISPDDLDIINEKRILRQQIVELEKGSSDDYKMAV
jgi:hypothetical protein